jgi:Arrestin (or S-antigen), C-terminal domain/Arrestin (or S-antigen), N-terminal domain
MILFGQLNGQPIEVSAGTHMYEFECELKDSLPPSFYTEECEISYNVEAFLDFPLGVRKKVRENFYVVHRDDAALYSNLKYPASDEEIKRFCCLFCKSNPFIMDVSIPQSIYSAGDSIPIKIKCSNRSDVKIESIHVMLKRKIEYTTFAPYEKSLSRQKNVAEKTERCVKAMSDEEFECILDIPLSTPASIEKFCKLIKITYKLLVEAKTDGMHIHPDCKLPIVLLNTSGCSGLDNVFASSSAKLNDNDHQC